MDHNTSLKSISIVVTLFAALIGGYLPLWYERYRKGQAILTHGYFFAKGIFLGTALLHMLPAAMAQFSAHSPNVEYPVIALVALLTIFGLHVIEQFSTRVLGSMAASRNEVTIYLLILLLSIHSIIEGAALGIGDGLTEILVILIAVLAHKGSAAFALVVNMQRHGFKYRTIHPVMLFFACMTPLGIVLGSIVNHVLTEYNGQVALSIMDAIAAGTFIYIACLEQDDLPELVENKSPVIEIISFGSGIAIMAVVAVWM